MQLRRGGAWGVKCYKLGELFKIASGGTPNRKKSEYFSQGDIPWIKTGDLKNKYVEFASEMISRQGLDNSSAKLFPRNTVLIAMYGATIGATSIMKISATTNQACAAFLPSEKVLPEYLYYFLLSSKRNFISKGVGGAQPNISATILKSIKIPLPPLPIQQKIAQVLDRADALRQRHRQIIHHYDQLAQSVFLEMFGDTTESASDVNRKMLLSEIAEITSGVTKNSKLKSEDTVTVPYMRVANVQDGYINLEEVKEIQVRRNDSEKYKLLPGDILLTEGGDPDKLGRGAVWYGQIEKCIHQNHIFRVRPNTEVILAEFLSALIGSKYGKKYFLKAAKQTTGIATINSTQLKKFPAIVPDLEVQNHFVSVKQRVAIQKQQQQHALAKSEELFQSLLQRAFKGELLAEAKTNPQMKMF